MTDPLPHPAGPDDAHDDPAPLPSHIEDTATRGSGLANGPRDKERQAARGRTDELEEQRLADQQLECIRRYQRDALDRQNPLEAVIACANADHLELRFHLLQQLKARLGAEGYSLDEFVENQIHMKELRNLTNQIHQFSQLEMKIHRTPQRDPFVRWGTAAPR